MPPSRRLDSSPGQHSPIMDMKLPNHHHTAHPSPTAWLEEHNNPTAATTSAPPNSAPPTSIPSPPPSLPVTASNSLTGISTQDPTAALTSSLRTHSPTTHHQHLPTPHSQPQNDLFASHLSVTPHSPPTHPKSAQDSNIAHNRFANLLNANHNNHAYVHLNPALHHTHHQHQQQHQPDHYDSSLASRQPYRASKHPPPPPHPHPHPPSVNVSQPAVRNEHIQLLAKHHSHPPFTQHPQLSQLPHQNQHHLRPQNMNHLQQQPQHHHPQQQQQHQQHHHQQQQHQSYPSYSTALAPQTAPQPHLQTTQPLNMLTKERIYNVPNRFHSNNNRLTQTRFPTINPLPSARTLQHPSDLNMAPVDPNEYPHIHPTPPTNRQPSWSATLLRDALRAFATNPSNPDRNDFIDTYTELMNAYEEKCDIIYDATDASCVSLILASRVPFLEDTITAPVDDETPEDARQKLIVKKKFVEAMEKLQEDQLPTKRRGNLPKESTTYLKKWFDDHYDHPYPTDEEKLQMSKDTKIGMTQISHWFINYRKRVWKPSLPPNHPVHTGDNTRKPRKKMRR